MDRKKFEERLATFLRLAQEMVNAYFAEHLPDSKLFILSTQPGARYVRIVRSDGSAWAFVDSENGNILKCDGWKRPAKGARGNIFDTDPLAGVNSYGANYAKRGKTP